MSSLSMGGAVAIANGNTFCPTCITGPNGGAIGIGGVAVWCKRHEMISREQAEVEYGSGAQGGERGEVSSVVGVFGVTS